MTTSHTFAGPAAAPTNFSRTTAGAVNTTVPNGTCSVATVTTGASGGSAGVSAATLGGAGGGGAIISANYRVLPLQAVTGIVGQGGRGAATGGTGAAAGGIGGTVTGIHRGGGGGGSTNVLVAGVQLAVAGGGGGGGAAHANTFGNAGGGGGSGGIVAGGVAPGFNGTGGNNNGGTPGGGQGGQAAAGGVGGTHSGGAATNGFAGGGIGSGLGGNGGVDPGNDSGGGGGGGYTGGGGGASTRADPAVTTAAGGGGGSSFLRLNSPIVAVSAATSVTGATRANTAFGTVNGADGAVTLNWVPCDYELAITKSVSPTPVRAGEVAVWTVSVTNNGPDPMTRGDTITLTDTLPVGPNGAPTPQFRVLSIATAGGTNTDMNSGAITCTGVTVGAAMPASTDCSRAYGAPSAPGAPSGGTRGLNVGETLTITYEQVISNRAPCGTITNTAAATDRSTAGSWTAVNRSIARNLVIQCYDLSVLKTRTPSVVGTGNPIDWTIIVTNNGTAAMMGPTDTASNPLIVTDVAPTTNVATPTLFSSSGPAGACIYAASTITCPGSLASGESQTFTFRQVVNAGAPNGAVISNTASVVDFNGGDSNDSSTTSSTTAAPLPALSVNKSPSVGTVSAAGTVVSYSIQVSNTGNTLLAPVNVSDPLGTVVCPVSGNATIASLAAGTNQTCTLSYAVPQSVLDSNGGGDADIDNTATVSATYNATPVSANGSTTVGLVISPAMTIDKIANTAGPVNNGNSIGYTYRITNTGNITISNVTVADVHNGFGTDPTPSNEVIFNDVAPLGNSTDAGTNASWDVLAPGDAIQFTSTYAVVQADIDNLQ